MKPITIGIGAAMLALSVAATSVAPAIAAPFNAGPNSQDWRRNNDNDWRRNNDNDWRRNNNRGKFERRGNFAYYNKHRGYRQRHPGYRYYNGFWFPPAAFIVGAIIGGAFANSGGGYYNNAHFEWCAATYRSYRASDNTFQPYHGPRQYCVSPYRG